MGEPEQLTGVVRDGPGLLVRIGIGYGLPKRLAVGA
jgi:hypothetical protein